MRFDFEGVQPLADLYRKIWIGFAIKIFESDHFPSLQHFCLRNGCELSSFEIQIIFSSKIS